jgi:hypothetical protein
MTIMTFAFRPCAARRIGRKGCANRPHGVKKSGSRRNPAQAIVQVAHMRRHATKSRPQGAGKANLKRSSCLEMSAGGATRPAGAGGLVKLPVGRISRQPTVLYWYFKGARECPLSGNLKATFNAV